MKKTIMCLMLASLPGCALVKVQQGDRECQTYTIGLFGASLGAPISNGCLEQRGGN